MDRFGQVAELPFADGIVGWIKRGGGKDRNRDHRVEPDPQSHFGSLGLLGKTRDTVDRGTDLVDHPLWLVDVGFEFRRDGAPTFGGQRGQFADADDRTDRFLDLQAESLLGLSRARTRIDHPHHDLVGPVVGKPFSLEHQHRGHADGQHAGHQRVHRRGVADGPCDDRPHGDGLPSSPWPDDAPVLRTRTVMPS